MVVANGRLIVVVGMASLLVAGCQPGGSLGEITKRAAEVAEPIVVGGQQGVPPRQQVIDRTTSTPSNLSVSRGAVPTEIILSWEGGDTPGSLNYVERSSDSGKSWVVRSTVSAGTQQYRDSIPAGAGPFQYRVRTQQQVDQEALERKRAEQLREQQRIREAEEREAERRRQEAERVAHEEAERVRLEAERLKQEEAARLRREAEAKAQREAEERKRQAEALAAQQKAEKEAKARAAEQARQAKEKRRQAKEKRRQEEREKKRALEALLTQAEQELAAGNLSAAEKSLKQYRREKGDSALSQRRYKELQKKISSMSQILADLEQTSDTEQQLQKLLAEGAALATHGDVEGARSRYNRVISIDPANSEARKGLEALSSKGKAVKKRSVAKKPAAKKRAESSLLGKKAEGWVVQVATYTEEKKKEAYGLMGAVKKAGFKGVFIKKQELAGRTLYRLRIGAYGEKGEAEALRDRINRVMSDRGVVSRVTLQKR